MIVVDTSAVVAILRSEAAAPQMLAKLIEAGSGVMSAANVLELQLVLNGREISGWPDVEELFRTHRIAVNSFDERQLKFAREAAVRYGKGRHRAALNYGDCFAYALARSEGVPLLCTGADFAATDLKIA